MPLLALVNDRFEGALIIPAFVMKPFEAFMNPSGSLVCRAHRRKWLEEGWKLPERSEPVVFGGRVNRPSDKVL